jgi:hypothetical protein
MPPTLRSLAWKQWRDNRWMILAIFLVYPPCIAATLFLRSATFNLLNLFITVYTVLFGLFAAWTIHHIRADIAMISSNALPIPQSRAALWSCVAGSLSLSISMLAAGLMFLPFGGHLVPYTQRIAYLLYSSFFGPQILFYALTLFLCARVRSWIGIFFTYAALAILYQEILSPPWAFRMSFAWLPDVALVVRTLLDIPTSALLISLLLWLASRRFVQSPARNRPIVYRAPRGVMPHSLPIHPILWKTWRETRPMIVGYLLIVLVLVPVQVFMFYAETHFHRWDSPLAGFALFQRNRPDFILSLAADIAFVYSIFFGIEIASRDRDQPLDFFVRSRPIHTRASILSTFWYGLLVSIAAVLFCCCAFFILYFLNNHGSDISSWDSQRRLALVVIPYETITSLLTSFAILVALSYAIAFFIATLVRHRLLALILAFIAGGLIVSLPNSTRAGGRFFTLLMLSPLAAITFNLLLLALAASIGNLAALSILRDWPARLSRFIARPRTPSAQPLDGVPV